MGAHRLILLWTKSFQKHCPNFNKNRILGRFGHFSKLFSTQWAFPMGIIILRFFKNFTVTYLLTYFRARKLLQTVHIFLASLLDWKFLKPKKGAVWDNQINFYFLITFLTPFGACGTGTANPIFDRYINPIYISGGRFNPSILFAKCYPKFIDLPLALPVLKVCTSYSS